MKMIPINLEKRTECEREAYTEGYAAGKRAAMRRGRWERKGYHLHCSCCDWSTDLATPYCPGCGAYLGGDAK